MAHLVKLDLFKETLNAIKDDNYIVNLLEYALNTGEEREHPVEQILQLLAQSAPKNKVCMKASSLADKKALRKTPTLSLFLKQLA